MRQIAEAGGVSKALLYHYFPNKIELFKAAVQEYAGELQHIIEPDGDGTPIEQLSESLDGYLAWIERNASIARAAANNRSVAPSISQPSAEYQISSGNRSRERTAPCSNRSYALCQRAGTKRWTRRCERGSSSRPVIAARPRPRPASNAASPRVSRRGSLPK